MTAKKGPELRWLPVAQLSALKRNPQLLTPHTMEALRASLRRDGFLAPVLVRPLRGGRWEIVSGNHRVMAAREEGMSEVPCVVVRLDDAAARPVAVNLNTIHGDPPAELLAPFLAEMGAAELGDVHLDDALRAELSSLDESLAKALAELSVPEGWDNPTPATPAPTCRCGACGKMHVPAG